MYFLKLEFFDFLLSLQETNHRLKYFESSIKLLILDSCLKKKKNWCPRIGRHHQFKSNFEQTPSCRFCCVSRWGKTENWESLSNRTLGRFSYRVGYITLLIQIIISKFLRYFPSWRTWSTAATGSLYWYWNVVERFRISDSSMKPHLWRCRRPYAYLSSPFICQTLLLLFALLSLEFIILYILYISVTIQQSMMIIWGFC